MNLLIEPWMPVRLRDGTRQWVAPTELSRPDVVAFDADRADFNGALAQFAIGLLQTTTPIDNAIAWRRAWASPPHPEELAEWFASSVTAFDLDGRGVRFMQDLELNEAELQPLPIQNLLIETPGQKTLSDNADHFVKRGHGKCFCKACAATALFVLQVNSPGDGGGHRTSLRGGGPLTTLLTVELASREAPSLWQSIWLNVLDQGQQRSLPGGRDKTAKHFTFPWCEAQGALQAPGGDSITAQEQTHPAHIFWGMPQRIRLLIPQDPQAGICDLCARPVRDLIWQYVRLKHGLNYKGPWKHTLTPYYEGDETTEDENGKKRKTGRKIMLPTHPGEGGLGYRYWPAWTIGSNSVKVEAATAISHFLGSASRGRIGVGVSLWAFGYDMKQKKARCWYESTMPLFDLPDCDEPARTALGDDVSGWVDSADLAAKYLRDAVKAGWFSKDARGDFSFIDASFWSATEAPFYAHLQARIQTAKAGLSPDRIDASERWLKTLQTAARKLFDGELVGAGAIERQNPARITAAHEQLGKNLYGPKLRQLLGLPIKEKPGAKRAVRNPRKPVIT